MGCYFGAWTTMLYMGMARGFIRALETYFKRVIIEIQSYLLDQLQ